MKNIMIIPIIIFLASCVTQKPDSEKGSKRWQLDKVYFNGFINCWGTASKIYMYDHDTCYVYISGERAKKYVKRK